MGIFIVWTAVISPRIWPPAKPVPPKPASPAGATVKPPQGAQPLPPVAPEVKQPEFAVEPPIPIETRHFKIEFTNKGAGILSMVLRYPDEKNVVPLLSPFESAYPHFALRHVGGPDRIESLPWKVVERKGNELVAFSFPLRNGIELRKEFRIDPATYTLKMSVDLKPPKPEEGKPPVEQTLQLEFIAFNGLYHENPYRYDQYFKGVSLVDGDVVDKPLGSVEKGEGKLAEAWRLPEGTERDGKIQAAREYFSDTKAPRKWAGLRNRFFAVLVLPDSHASERVQSFSYRSSSPEAVRSAGGLKNLNVSLLTVPIKLSTQSDLFSFSVYAGPVQKEPLAQMADAPRLFTYGAGCIIPPGIIDVVGSVILGILKFFAGLLHNWGLGIIATTLLIRICISPLSKKSQESAYRMQQLGPKIAALRERYPDDKQKFGTEQMRLFRENKINPLSGCLPLLLQLPIFIGMFSVFDTSIELRGQPFFGWMDDLSRPDRLIEWKTPFDVFFLPTLNSLNVLPIIMTITWFLQAYFAPRSPDPQMQQQQKMMLAMPVIFGLMCYNYAAGLSLYFFVNSLLAMVEQKVIKKYILKIPPDGQGPAPSTGSARV